MEYDNSNTVLKPIATQSIGTEVIPHTPMIAIASSQEGSQYHAQDDFCQYSFGYIGSLDPILNICRIPNDKIKKNPSLIIHKNCFALTKRGNNFIFYLISCFRSSFIYNLLQINHGYR